MNMASDRKMWGRVLAFAPEGDLRRGLPRDSNFSTGQFRRHQAQAQLIDLTEARRTATVEPFVQRGEDAMARKSKAQSKAGAGQTANPEPSAASGPPPPAQPAQEGKVHPRIMDRHMQSELGRHLRAMFDDVASSPVPDKFLKLLQDLESKEKQR